ncbi:hypothetical protein [Aquibacillus saliphilus]|uniref:hypothetical protein n=1 Tax=Aquibacillus saliphilus TaxID=1909422 RepID=UPI001CF04B63|nr:hypothetical protein [Aquibacillus saliphilus]
MSKMDEQILVTPREKIFENESLAFQGVNSDKDNLNKVLENIETNFSVMRRGDAEDNFNYKQPIPYAVVRRVNEVFVYKRLTGGGEKRLHNQLSIGVGGHMNKINTGNFEIQLFENLRRELDEELDIQSSTKKLEIIGLINDDGNEVGKVHIGLLATVDLDRKATVKVKETEQLEGEWINVKSLVDTEVYDNLETWSQFVADILNK